MSVPDEEFQVRQDVVPFVMVPHWLLEAGVTGHALTLYVALGTFTTGQGGNCYPTRETLAAKMGVSVSTMQRAMGDLEACGAIRVERRKAAAGDNTSNMYHLAFTERFSVSPGQKGVGSRVNRPRVTGEPTGGVTGDPQTRTTPNKNQGTTPAGGVADATGGDVELFHVDEPRPLPTAGTLVQAWCEGWSESRDGRSPDDSVVRRVAGSCKQVAKTRTDLESWRTAWQAAKDAGRQGRYDVVAHLADFQPPIRNNHTEYGKTRTQQAMRMIDRLRAEDERMNELLNQNTDTPLQIEAARNV